MKIYVGHATRFNYYNELYQPLMQSNLWQQYTWYLPHLDSSRPINTKTLIHNCDLVIAEVSLPSTGLGIELGWANSAQVPIIAIHKIDAKISSSLELICLKLIAYDDLSNLLKMLNLEVSS